jgi:uncharacterized protein YecE (DUF72 family)
MGLYLGCPIWAYKGWVGNFFPEGTKPSAYLREYTRRLTTVEGNTTFYATPSRETLQGWFADMPPEFRFCPKMPRTVSHSGNLGDRVEEARQFSEVMTHLGERLGPLFLQLPPSYPPSRMDDLETFLEVWPRLTQLAVEVRHPDWFDPPHSAALDSLLSGLEMARVVFDTRPIRGLQGDDILKGSVYQRLLEARQRKPDVPVHREPTATFFFLRYIGHPQRANNTPFIKEWAISLAGWLRQGIEIYVFCHCPDEGLDPWLCREFHQEISARVDIPDLPWDVADRDLPVQPRLF